MSEFFIKKEGLTALAGKTVVVTGGSSGIGLATVELLLELGASVVMGDLNSPPIEHEKLAFMKTNVASWADLVALFKRAKQLHGRIDHVFSNAGINGRANYLEDKFDSNGELQEPDTLTYDINLHGMINTSYLGLHYFRNQEPAGGSVVCTASASSFQRFRVTDYATTKHGVLGWMRGIVPNLTAAGLPIRVNAIAPSWTMTGLVPKQLAEKMKRPLQSPEVVARSVACLMTDSIRQGQLIYSAEGRFFEAENILLPAAANVVGLTGTKKNEDQDLADAQEHEQKAG